MTSTIGTVYLKVADLDRLVQFYTDIIGLQVQRQAGDTVYLGAGGDDLLALIHRPDNKRYPRTTGLYHLALLLPSRYDLALSLNHLIQTQTRLQGASDHLVSEAVYLADPEGNGIEIYRDRPREDWYTADGRFRLDTIALDVEGVMGTLNGQPTGFHGLPAGTTMGHIHLHVASIPESRKFYTEMLEMGLMMDAGSALFLSYEGYHHHLGANVWGGTAQPPQDALGLEKFTLHIEDADQRQHLLAKFDGHSQPDEHGILIRDPARNAMVITG